MIRNYEKLHRSIQGTGDLTAILSFEPCTEIWLRPNYLAHLMKGKSVLHIGCTDHMEVIDQRLNTGTHLHRNLSEVTSKCLGIDINRETIAHVRSKGMDNVIYGDVTKPGIKEIEQSKWDFILFGELLEHTDNPVEFLNQCYRAYGKYINQWVITVPNAFGIPFLVSAFSKGCEMINSDHRYWFTPYTAWKVVNRANFNLVHMQMCLYERSAHVLAPNRELLLEKPLMLDTIVVICERHD